jgi:hypothetical protein
LDFLIVVFGVYLGIQIGNWNEGRLDEVAYQKAHKRMIAETHSNIQSAQRLLKLASPMLSDFTLATNDLRNCRDDKEAKARIDTAIALLSGTFSLRLDKRALSELTTSQRLLERQPSEKVELYSGYLKKLNTTLSWGGKVLDKMEFRSDDLHPFISYGEIRVSPTSELVTGRELVLGANISEACKDDAFLKMFYLWESGHLYQIGLIEEFISDSQAYLLNLGETHTISEGDL